MAITLQEVVVLSDIKMEIIHATGLAHDSTVTTTLADPQFAIPIADGFSYLGDGGYSAYATVSGRTITLKKTNAANADVTFLVFGY